MQEPRDLEDFCRGEYPRLVGALGLYTGETGLAEELAQEALARVCVRWHDVGRMAAPGAWAHRVAMNLAKSRFRRRQAGRRAHARLAAAGTTSYADPDTAGRLALTAALAHLPERQRAVVVCRYYLGMSMADTAHTLGMPEGTAKSLASRALAALRVALELDELEESR